MWVRHDRSIRDHGGSRSKVGLWVWHDRGIWDSGDSRVDGTKPIWVRGFTVEAPSHVVVGSGGGLCVGVCVCIMGIVVGHLFPPFTPYLLMRLPC